MVHIVFIVSFIFLTCTTTRAQQDSIPQEPSASKVLSEVIISANKFEMLSKDTPVPVQVITRKELAQREGQTLSQLLQDQPGIVINGAYSNPGATKSVFLRGAATEFTLFLIDGMPAYDPSGPSGAALDLRLLAVETIERIEILKGNQSALYGSGAIAGVINIITKKDQKNVVEVGGKISFGSLNTHNTSVNVGGKKGVITYGAGFHYLATDGMSEATKKPNATNNEPFDKDGQSLLGGNARMSIALGKNVTISPFVRYSKNNGDYDYGAFTDADDSYESELLHTGMAANYEAQHLKIKWTYGYVQTNRFFTSSFGDNRYKGYLHDMDIYASYSLFNNKLDVSGGINYQHQEMKIEDKNASNPPLYQLAPYVAITARPLRKVAVALNYRYTHYSNQRGNSSYSLTPSYQIINVLKLFASYSRGYKIPTLSQLYGFGANESLKPQISSSWQAGLRYNSVNDKIDASITYYARRITNLIIYYTSPPSSPFPSSLYINRDIQSDQGVEMAINWSISKALSIALNYDFVTGYITEKTRVQNNLIRRPRHSIKAVVSYLPIRPLFIAISGHYIGARTDTFYNPENLLTEQVSLAPYFLLNARMNYSWKQKMTIFLDMKNMTNTKYTELYGYNTLKFTIQAGITFKLQVR